MLLMTGISWFIFSLEFSRWHLDRWASCEFLIIVLTLQKKHFCSLKQQFILYIDFCGAISSNAFSVAPSKTIKKQLFSTVTLSMNSNQHKHKVSLCCESIFYCYAECPYSKRHYAECPSAKCCSTECRCAKCHSNKTNKISNGSTNVS